MGPVSFQPKIHHWDFPEDDPAGQHHNKLRKELKDVFDGILQDRFSLSSIDSLIYQLDGAMKLDKWGLFRFFLSGKWNNPDVTTSSLHTAILCHLFATARRWTEGKVVLLVRAALLHDVGMLFLPSHLLVKTGRLSDQEREAIEAHPSMSYERVKKWGESFESTQVALQHHEEWAGGGYPQGIDGAGIHPWAALLAVVLNFVARSTQRNYRDSLVGYSAVKQLIQEQNTRFSPTWVREFVSVFGLNPPGGIVLLSDGSIARVLESNTGKPLRPKLRILIDRFGNEFRSDQGAIFDLAAAPKIYIARPVNFQDIQDAKNEKT